MDRGASDEVAPSPRGLRRLVACGKRSPSLLNLRALQGPFVKKEPITLRQGLAFVEMEVSTSLLGLVAEGPNPKGVCGQETIVPSMPPRRVAQILVMIKNGNHLSGAS